MISILEKISDAKHVQIVVQKEYLFVASALYTYVLTQHKKVSLICKSEELGYKFLFLPWIDKVKKNNIQSADVNIELQISGLELYQLFKKSDIAINKKMATALYGAIVNDTDGFKNKSVDGMIFAATSELLNLGADHSLVVEHIVNYSSLARLRLKSIMLQNMILLNSSKASLFELQEQDLSSTGATIEDAKELIKEAFLLPYVEMSILLDSSQENEIIKIIDKDI